MPDNLIVLEQGVPLSQSKIWEWHQDFYLRLGAEAWRKSVPHYVTSNPYIADGYTEIILSFVSEWVEKKPEAIVEPFYIVELGAGHAKFSFYLLKRLTELRPRWPSALKLCYVITDFSEKNIAFSSSHPNFKPYIEQGLLDFALFDLEKKNSLMLKFSKKELGSTKLKNPLIVCANYILDSIRKDSFYVDERYKLRANLVKIKAKPTNIKNNVPLRLNELIIEFDSKLVGRDHYEEEIFNEILLAYNQEICKKSFLLPIAAFRLMDFLNKLSREPLFLISSDKGYLSTDEFSSSSVPHIAFHDGCFSMMTNYDALARYFKIQGGDAFIQAMHHGLATCAFISKLKFSDLPKTQTALDIYLNSFSPQDYFNIYQTIENQLNCSSLETLGSYLSLSRSDPHVFNYMTAKINVLIAQADSILKVYFTRIVRLVAKNFYYMPGCVDVLFDVGLFFHTMHEYKEAIFYYKQSLEFFSERFNTLYNLGLCYYHLYSYEEAENYFANSLKLQPDARAQDWLKQVRKKNGRSIG